MDRKLTSTQRTIMVTTVGATAAVSLTAGLASIAAAEPAAVRAAADSGELKVCVDGGQMRMVKKSTTKCSGGDRLVTWNIEGDQGPKGPKGPVGADGTDGAAGAAGAKGATGATGLTGATGAAGAGGGATGAAGAAGATGASGNTVLSGTTSPPNSASGAIGDYYINYNFKTIYGPKTSTGWGSSAPLQGGLAAYANTTGTPVAASGTGGTTATASCTAPAKVTGGGFSLSGGDDEVVVNRATSDTVWTVTTRTPTGGSGGTTVTAYVLCAMA